MKYQVNVDLNCLGIVEGKHKREIEKVMPLVEWQQRKDYDEYYVAGISKHSRHAVSMVELLELSKELKIEIDYGTVRILN